MPTSTIPTRPNQIKDISGQKFGRLTVVRFSHIRRTRYKNRGTTSIAMWECLCRCGQVIVVRSNSVLSGITKSCGCFLREKRIESGRRSRKHGQSMSSEYKAWQGMKQRCYNKNSQAYKWYGARGITICKRWRNSFELFYKDMGERPGPEYSIDRIDNNGPYSKKNCRWSLKLEQGRNKRNNRILEFRGERLCISEWAKRLGYHHCTITTRLRRGWSVEKALTTAPLGPGRTK